MLIYTFGVLSLAIEETTVTQQASHRPIKANPACGHKEVRRSTGHIMVTTRYSNQLGSKSRQFSCQVQPPENIGDLSASIRCPWVRTTVSTVCSAASIFRIWTTSYREKTDPCVAHVSSFSIYRASLPGGLCYSGFIVPARTGCEMFGLSAPSHRWTRWFCRATLKTIGVTRVCGIGTHMVSVNIKFFYQEQTGRSICMYVCTFIKLHITAQSGPVIRVILCHSYWSSQGGINDTCYVCMYVCIY